MPSVTAAGYVELTLLLLSCRAGGGSAGRVKFAGAGSAGRVEIVGVGAAGRVEIAGVGAVVAVNGGCSLPIAVAGVCTTDTEASDEDHAAVLSVMAPRFRCLNGN
ncbi:hypothetical protein PF005_g4145 [Phytophthora fragariae]|uniref:Secreted protein n=1 Tax=Phytophthora fragariae TaxID=53985 RepID=A0A6A4EFZ2_9STRA|nr:hypothetical protein PF003_g17173 [Phytophthora fragariae]KAE8947152.1 hypothetical protein PF009_g3248 [Phytophthora fragariae]KAE9007158.1 hypothetical protein PF011_g11247 [Phytophthora fragariae]KAE9120789.1 hypothetical protein PF010_g7357 [Phytophthora fragariae]KAE9131801.1 hypothetical protein PF007_g3970 [Phytophthora fragariae]